MAAPPCWPENRRSGQAFEASIAKADLNPSQANATVRKEATFGLAAAALKSETARPAALRHFDEATRPAASSRSPLSSPLSSPMSSP